MMASAEQLKDQGNTAIKLGKYQEAEQLYTQAIIKDPTNFKLYTNRAFARLKTHDWAGAALDAESASRLDACWMKAYRHAAVAYGKLGRHDDAVAAATQAFSLCTDNPATSRNDLVSTSDLVLAARRQRWEARERARLDGTDPLLAECCDAIWARHAEVERDLDQRLAEGRIAAHQRDQQADEAWREARRKTTELRAVFAKADPRLRERHVPDCYIDRISFNFMIDPVVTKNGQSYERSHLMEHLRHSPRDPLTGEPMSERDVRPNIALREACEAFLFENEWAAEY